MCRLNRLVWVLLLGVAGCGAAYDPEPYAPSEAPTPNLTLEALHARYPAPYNGVYEVVNEELVVRGIITSDDRAGNCYQSLYIEQEGHALQLRVGLTQLQSRYPKGCRLTVALRGLCIGREHGVLQAGSPISDFDNSKLGAIESQVRIDSHLFRGEKGEEPTPRRLPIEELTLHHCGSLVELSNLSYAPLGEEEPLWEGYHRFTDPQGLAIHSYCSPYARFAGESLSDEVVTLTGHLEWLSQGQHAGFVLIPRDEEDLR